MGDLSWLTKSQLVEFAKELGIKLEEVGGKSGEAYLIKKIKEAGITYGEQQEAFERFRNNQHCDKCGKNGLLDVSLFYCKKCEMYFCIKCVITSEREATYAGYSITTYVKCPKEHFIGNY